jgi:hypothetical protein
VATEEPSCSDPMTRCFDLPLKSTGVQKLKKLSVTSDDDQKTFSLTTGSGQNVGKAKTIFCSESLGS